MQNPLSLRAFLSWVEKQPADERYRYINVRRCPIALYFKSLGREYSIADWWDEGETAAVEHPHTFGALASRLREQVQ